MKDYELTVLLHPDLEMNLDPAVDKVKKLIESNGGKIVKEENDGKGGISVRTGEKYDASAICAHFGGGGHIRAGGCEIKGTVEEAKEKILEYTVKLGLGIGIVGLYNIQFIVDKNDDVYVIEVNPRSSRTVPFLSKSTGYPLADIGFIEGKQDIYDYIISQITKIGRVGVTFADKINFVDMPGYGFAKADDAYSLN